MKKMIYFYLLVSLPCGICILWDTHPSLFAMEESKVKEPAKTESTAAQEKQLQEEELLLEQEKASLEQEKQKLAQQQAQLQTSQPPVEDSQKTPPLKSSDIPNILVEEKTKEEEIEKTQKEIEALSKELAAEFITNEPSTQKSITPEPSPITICIGSLIMQNITKAQNIFADKNNKDSFTELTNELDSIMEQLAKYESDKIGQSYYTMNINDIQTRRNNMLKTNPQNKDYDKIYAQLVNQEQSIRAKIKRLIEEKTNAEVDLINSIIEGCANKRFINILLKGEEASESILSED